MIREKYAEMYLSHAPLGFTELQTQSNKVLTLNPSGAKNIPWEAKQFMSDI